MKRMYESQQLWDMRRKNKLEVMRREKARKEFDGCTFKPKVKAMRSSKNLAISARSGQVSSKRA
jgi:hypothetical protein